MLTPRLALLLLLCASSPWAQDRPGPWVREVARAGDFALVNERGTADLVADPGDHRVVSIAVADLSRDIARMTGREPSIRKDLSGASPSTVLIGTLGRSALIDGLANAGRIDVSPLRGAWESFVITTVEAPAPGIREGLVIVGSDRRGTVIDGGGAPPSYLGPKDKRRAR